MNNGYQKSNGCGADKEGGEIFKKRSVNPTTSLVCGM